MTAQIIDGKAIAATIREEIKAEVEALQAATGQTPGLAAVLVGDRTDSQTYVRMKKKACAEVGINSIGRDPKKFNLKFFRVVPHESINAPVTTDFRVTIYAKISPIGCVTWFVLSRSP